MAAQVSVVIIFLDAARFLREAVASVLAQDFTDWELVLVDDGSSDASTAIARECAAAHPGKIRYVDHPGHANRGMSAARNLGVASSHAPLLAFLDSDDLWVASKLGEQVALMRAHPRAGIVFGRTRFWFGWTGAARDRARDIEWRLDRPTGLAEPPTLVYHAPLGNCLKPSMSNFMARRAALERIGGFEDAFRNLREDYVFWVKAFHDLTVFHADACWDWCRHHPASHSSIVLSPRDAREEEQRYYRWVVEYLAARDRDDPFLRSIAADFRLRLARPDTYRLSAGHHLGRLRRAFLRARRAGIMNDVRGRVSRAWRGAW